MRHFKQRSVEEGVEQATHVFLLVEHRQLPDVVLKLVEHVHLRTLLLPLLALGKDRRRNLAHRLGRKSDRRGLLFGSCSLPHPSSSELFAGLFLHLAVGLELLFVGKSVGKGDSLAFEVGLHWGWTGRVVVLLPKVDEDVGEVDVLFLHFLVVASALLGLPSPHKNLHGLEDLVGSPHVTVDEVLVVDLQKPMVTLVLLRQPVPVVHLSRLLLAPLPTLGGPLAWRNSSARAARAGTAELGLRRLTCPHILLSWAGRVLLVEKKELVGKQRVQKARLFQVHLTAFTTKIYRLKDSHSCRLHPPSPPPSPSFPTFPSHFLPTELSADSGSYFQIKINMQQPLFFPGGERFEGSYLNPSTPLQGTMHYSNGDRYEGSFRNNLRDGVGNYHYQTTKEVYEGQWQQDLWHGRGTYSVVSGQVKISGVWERGILNGPAEVVHSNGDRFVGVFRNGMKQGQGEIFYGNGAYFKGKFSQDKPNGPCIFRYSSSTTYEGTVKNGLKNGTGKMTSPQGIYTGSWANDQKNGHGTMKFSNMDEYEGGWKNGLREGEGEYRYNNGDHYRGSWVRDKKEGRGTLRMETGDVYNGQWRNGKKHGSGRYTFANSDFYEGQFVEGNRFGLGKYSWTDGSFYEGQWKRDKMNGQGTYRGNDGVTVRGLFVDDNLVEPEEG